MDRAEERALEVYPQNGDNLISKEGYRIMRSIYVDGYHQAEKDLESLPKIHGWVARDKDGSYTVELRDQPVRIIPSWSFAALW